MQALKTVGPCLRPDWQHLSPRRLQLMGPFHFKIQQKAGPGSYPSTNGMRGGPTSSLAVGAAVGTTVTGCRCTHQGKILKTSFLLLTSPFTLTKLTADLCQLLRNHKPKHSQAKPECLEDSSHGTG